jgi:hypothetical protein
MFTVSGGMELGKGIKNSIDNSLIATILGF